MTGDVRLLIVAPVLLFFGCKLAATGALLWSLTHGQRPYWPVIFVLGCLAFLQFFVMVGFAQREDFARRLGVGVCIAGATVGIVVCLVAPVAWLLAWPVSWLGAALASMNAAALGLLLTEAAREWCDE